MKNMLLIWCAIAFIACYRNNTEEMKIRKSINRYLSKIKAPKDLRNTYLINVDTFDADSYITFLRKENMTNCNASISEAANARLEEHRLQSKGMPRLQVDNVSPATLQQTYLKIDDSLANLKIDKSRNYYKVDAYRMHAADTIWKNVFWLNDRYELIGY
jgi:hypothetical protein